MRGAHKSVIGLVLILTASSPAAQTLSRPAFTQSDKSTPADTIRALLQSADAREQAWGAWYAGSNALSQLAPLLQQVVELRALDGSLAAHAAFDAAVDALIQLNAKPPEAIVRLVHERSQAAALILASHNREAMSDFLRDVAEHGREDDWFAAANLLLQSRTVHHEPRGFAAILLKPLSIRVEIFVSDTGGMGGGGGVGGSVGCGAGGAAPGLPPWTTYTLTTYAHSGVVVHATGPTPTYYRRTVVPAGSAPARSVSTRGAPTGEDRLRYVAVLAGVEESQLLLRGVEWHSVKWQGAEHLEQTVLRLRADIVSRHAHLVRVLLQGGALADDEARALPPVRIDVALHDGRSDKSPALSR